MYGSIAISCVKHGRSTKKSGNWNKLICYTSHITMVLGDSIVATFSYVKSQKGANMLFVHSTKHEYHFLKESGVKSTNLWTCFWTNKEDTSCIWWNQQTEIWRLQTVLEKKCLNSKLTFKRIGMVWKCKLECDCHHLEQALICYWW